MSFRPMPKRQPAMAWSPEQMAIFEWFRTGKGNLVVRARAGTGKTTTIKEAFNHAPEFKMLYAVFNKKNQKEAEGKITNSGVEVKTLHSLGFAFIKRVWSNAKPDETNDIEFERAKLALLDVCGIASREMVGIVVKLVGFLKNTTINPTAEDAALIAQDQDCLGQNNEEDSVIVSSAMKVLELSKVRDATGRISFNDMVWLPVAMNWVKQWYDLAVIDEAQDMNLPQLTMARLCVKNGGRVVVVGDDRQAIYIFRGAVHNSLSMMKVTLRASELTLTVTYRCPKLVVQEAQSIVPDYKAADAAPLGILARTNEYGAMNMLKPGDAVLSRLNAPLMPMALALLRKQIPARIEGRDIGKQIAGMVRSMKASTVPAFVKAVTEWAAKQRERLEHANNAEKQLEKVADLAATLICLSEGCESVNGIQSRIDDLFQDTDKNSRPAVILSSVHKAKGLEWSRVFILSETFRKTTLEENNIYYVAITRAMQELWFIAGKGQAVSPQPQPAIAEAKPADAVETKPAPKIPSREQVQAKVEQPIENKPVTETGTAVPAPSSPADLFKAVGAVLNPQIWMSNEQGGFETALPGDYWRTPGTVFMHSGMEYVSVKCSMAGAQCKAMGKVKVSRKAYNAETGQDDSKTVEYTPTLLRCSASIGRDQVIRLMTEKELSDFLAGVRPAAARTITNNTNNAESGEQVTEENDMAKKIKKAKGAAAAKVDRKPVAGRADYIHKKKAGGMKKKDALAAVKAAGFDCSEAAFNRIWDANHPISRAAGKATAKAKAPAKKASKTPPARKVAAKAPAKKASAGGPPARSAVAMAPAAPAAPAAAPAPAPAAPAEQAAPAATEPVKA